jgi:hypothetical protein
MPRHTVKHGAHLPSLHAVRVTAITIGAVVALAGGTTDPV